jgi:hypothetical protein
METEKLYLNQMTLTQMYKLFGLKEVRQMNDLDNWLSDLPELTNIEKLVIELYQNRLLKNIGSWNDDDLSFGFIGPMLSLIDFNVDYQLKFFAKRPISAAIDDFELIGEPDCIIASGHFEPEIPFFSFHQFKKEIDKKENPVGQNLATMLIGQTLSNDNLPIYGCYVNNESWFFMVLKEKEYAISQAFRTTRNDIYDIVKILKSLRNILFTRLNIEIE